MAGWGSAWGNDPWGGIAVADPAGFPWSSIYIRGSMSTQTDITKADGWFIGEDKNLVFTITSGGAVQNITGWTIQFALADVFSGVSDVTKTAALTDAPAGVCTVSILSADTIGINPETDWWYRLRRVDSGSRSELAFGSVDLLDVFVD